MFPSTWLSFHPWNDSFRAESPSSKEPPSRTLPRNPQVLPLTILSLQRHTQRLACTHLGVVLSLALVLCPEFRSTMTAQADQPKSRDRPFVAEYYYKARWSDTDEFIRLFKKNHLPVLKKQIETRRILRVSAVKPRYHATEDGRWDYRVTIVFKDVAAAAHDASGEEVRWRRWPSWRPG